MNINGMQRLSDTVDLVGVLTACGIKESEAVDWASTMIVDNGMSFEEALEVYREYFDVGLNVETEKMGAKTVAA